MKCLIEESVLIREYSYIGIGGVAFFMAFPENVEEIIESLEFARKKRLMYKVAGMMSNTLYSDKGYEGLIVNTRNIIPSVDIENNRIVIRGDMKISGLINICKKENIMDLAFLAGIPGMLMSAVKVNAGAWGKNIGNVVEWIEVIDDGSIKMLKREDIEFSYRYSNIRGIIVGVSLKIGEETGDVEEYINEKLKYRRQHHPSQRSLGSVFKNPKPLIAGKLIEECGLKGMRIGDMMISEKHGNFIVNLGDGTAEEMIELMRIVKSEVKRKKGIELEPEIEVIDEKGQKILI